MVTIIVTIMMIILVIIIVINMITESYPPVGPCGRPLEHVVLATFQRHIHDGDLACPSQIYERIGKYK